MEELAARFYRSLYLIRRAEEEIARIYPSDDIKSPVHLYIGQEAVSVGVCEALAPTDVVFGSYRSHGYYLAKGGDLRRMMAELYGKQDGCARGKGGSMHLVDAARGVMGASAVVGTTIPLAVGYAYAEKLRRRPTVVVSFFGDGATEEGVYHESLNFAALKGVPVLFVCENNQYAIHTHVSRRQKRPEALVERARSYGIPAERIDGSDVMAVHRWAAGAAARLRAGEGPAFAECMTYRWREHVGPSEDYDLGYRGRDELLPWLERDPVRQVSGMVAPGRRLAIEQEVEAEIRDAVAFAEASPFPDPRALLTDVYGTDERP